MVHRIVVVDRTVGPGSVVLVVAGALVLLPYDGLWHWHLVDYLIVGFC